MITLRNKESGNTIGTISEADLEEEKASPELIALLRRSLTGRDGVEIEWSRA